MNKPRVLFLAAPVAGKDVSDVTESCGGNTRDAFHSSASRRKKSFFNIVFNELKNVIKLHRLKDCITSKQFYSNSLTLN